MGMIGKLDRMAQFRRYTEFDDGYQTVQHWADHGHPMPVSRHDISDGERFAMGQVLSILTSRFLIRFSAFTADLTPADRMRCDGRLWALDGIKELPDPRRAWLEITATRLPDE